MAISATHYQLLRDLRRANQLAVGEPILEIGQANFYGDADPNEWLADIHEFVAPEKQDEIKQFILGWLRRSETEGQSDPVMFGLAKCIYAILFGSERIDAIDKGSYHKYIDHDLNLPYPEAISYPTVINHGTAEHIFNIAQVFRTIHDATSVGGLMIHESPFTGWVDHGFYTLQPTLFYDVAQANGYDVVLMAVEHLASRSYFQINSLADFHALALRDQLPYNAMLFVALRKKLDKPFEIPMQGVYAGSVSADTWRAMR